MLITEYNTEGIEDEEYYEVFEEENFQNFEEEIEEIFKDFRYPVTLIAKNSNWLGQTGYSWVNSTKDMLRVVTSFDSPFYELHRIRNSYEFHLASHDVPTGFIIEVRKEIK